MKNNINELLKNADDETLNTLAERYPAAGKKEREKIYGMIVKKSGSTDNSQHNEVVCGVDIYRRPKWHKNAAVAASIVAAVLGISGTFFSVSRFKAPTDTVPSQYHSVEATTKTTPPEFDITTKEGIYQKMLNSVYYYNKVSGEMVLSTDNSTSSLIVDFETDLEKSVSYSHSENFRINFENDKYVSGNMQFTYCDGTQIYRSDVILHQNEQIGLAAKRGEMPAAKDDPTRYADVTNLPSASIALVPRLEILNLIDNSEYWEISGTETYLGRGCTTIAGEIKEGYSEENDILSYWLCVDNKTGIVLKYIMSGLSGEYQQLMLVRNIAFDDDVEVRDLTEYVRSDTLSEYDPGSSERVIAVIGYNGKTGFIKAMEILSDDPETLDLNVYDTDLKTVIDRYSFEFKIDEMEVG